MIFHDQELTMVFIRYHDRSCGSVCDHQCALMSTTAEDRGFSHLIVGLSMRGEAS
jgi:hypothetical protein